MYYLDSFLKWFQRGEIGLSLVILITLIVILIIVLIKNEQKHYQSKKDFFCPACGQKLILNNEIFICPKCGWKEELIIIKGLFSNFKKET